MNEAILDHLPASSPHSPQKSEPGYFKVSMFVVQYTWKEEEHTGFPPVKFSLQVFLQTKKPAVPG